MENNYLNIYNNLIKLTRNKNLYIKLKKQDTFSDRLTFLLFHFGFLLKSYKNGTNKKESQKLFNFIIRQIDLSIREIGYGDASVNKKMKELINLLYSIIDKIEFWEKLDFKSRGDLIGNYLNLTDNLDFYADYFEKYRIFLTKSTLNNFTKDIINFKF